MRMRHGIHDVLPHIRCLSCQAVQEIIAAAQEERFTRIKHDSSIPEHAMKYCLEEAGAEPEDLDAVVYYDPGCPDLQDL